MKRDDRYDSLIQYWTESIWSGQDWRLIKAVIKQESSFDPIAVSECGAIGLMQLMPATANELGCTTPYNPEANMRAGINYLMQQYMRFPEILNPFERIKFALASYNAGRGTINHAIRHEIEDHGRAGGTWQEWVNVVDELPEVQSQDNARQTTQYVDRILKHWAEYKGT